MYQTNLCGPFLHPRDESNEIRLISIGRVPPPLSMPARISTRSPSSITNPP